jgi:hypothetical protein
MSGPRLASPATFRLVAASAAAVASLGVVALGVQLGTHGLVGDGPGRNPGSASASPVAAVVDARSPVNAPVAIGFDALPAVSPALGNGTFASLSAGPSGAISGVAAGDPAAGPSSGGSGTTGGSDGSGTSPLPPAGVPAPPVAVPSTPEPTIPPALDPILDPVVDTITGATTGPESSDPQTTAPAPTSRTSGTLESLVQSLLGR